MGEGVFLREGQGVNTEGGGREGEGNSRISDLIGEWDSGGRQMQEMEVRKTMKMPEKPQGTILTNNLPELFSSGLTVLPSRAEDHLTKSQINARHEEPSFKLLTRVV